MQHLQMSSENQEMVKETLLSLQSEDNLRNKNKNNDDAPDQGSDEPNIPAENQYPLSDCASGIPDVQAYETSVNNQKGATPDMSQENALAMRKIQRCGFDAEYCVLALQLCNGNEEAALEYLLNDLININLSVKDEEESVQTGGVQIPDRILEERVNEKLALQCMYADAFKERIPNKSWVINLQLPELRSLLSEKSASAVNDKKNSHSEQDHTMNEFYSKGSSLTVSDEVVSGNSSVFSESVCSKLNALEDDIKSPFCVEVRFPEGNKYPQEPPLVVFISMIEELHPHTCLNITQFLMSVSRDAAADHLPCVSTFVTALQNKNKLVELLNLPPPELKKLVPVKEADKLANTVSAISTSPNSFSSETTDISKPNKQVVSDTSAVLDEAKRERGEKTDDRDDNSTVTDGKKDIQSSRYTETKILNKVLQDEFQARKNSVQYQNMLSDRQRLPAWDMKEDVTKVIAENQVVVISGMTGCGKTTQVPQFILDEALQQHDFNANIVCTQPRRISAMSVAQRVADERAEGLGRSVGYQIRLECVKSSFTRLQYCTTGIVLRRLESDRNLEGVTHIIIDEVHERSEESYSLETRSPYARAHKRFTARQNYDTKGACDKVTDMNLSLEELKYRYPGHSNFTIKTLSEMDLEKMNYDLIVELLEWIVTGKHEFPSEGAILVFLPGYAEIQSLYDKLLSTAEFGSRNKHRYKIIPLHSSLSSEDQNTVFQKPEEGVTKIVIATNIAETSITINDIVFVVDAGRMKENRYDQTKSMESLDTVWVSKANALQRRGRAGRVQEGVCFHLFTSHHFNFHLREQPTPEIQRASLEHVVLKVKMLPAFDKQNSEMVMKRLIEPPSLEAIRGAVKCLIDLGALNEFEKLTSLGYHVGSLQVDVRIGKLMLFGAIFRCLDSALTIAATLSFKSPFFTPFDKKKEATEKRKEFAMENSDYLTMLNAYKGWCEAKKRGPHQAYLYCRENFLDNKCLQMLARQKQQFVELLSDAGFVSPGIRRWVVERAARGGSDGVKEVTGMEANINSGNWKLMSAMLVAALYPNIIQVPTRGGLVLRGMKRLQLMTKSDGDVHIHPTSVNFQVKYYPSPFLVFHKKVKTTKIYIRDSSMVSVYPLLLFAGGRISIDQENVLSVDDGWIKFRASSQVAELVRNLRLELDQLLSDNFSQPHQNLLTCPRGTKIINCVVSLISRE